ncbi:MAG TPA: HAD family hydrolase [Candidatus Binataceae bacterium]|nr:HAD family hydrolase [Candidatus Binataceae bacterium]
MFRAIVLDLFDTLVDWDPNGLPLMMWKGREIHTTLPWLLPKVAEALGEKYNADTFVTSYAAVQEEINAEKERDGIEITCLERFERTLGRIGMTDNIQLRRLAEDLTRIHMRGVRSVTSAPANRKDAVRRLAERYRLGLLSNFDDSQTGWEIMADTGVKDKFEAIIISADLRLRKPNPKIFAKMLAMLNLEARDVLFVGDTPHHDVGGAKAVGMAAAWISRHALPLPEGVAQPDYIIRDLAELPDVLEASR